MLNPNIFELVSLFEPRKLNSCVLLSDSADLIESLASLCHHMPVHLLIEPENLFKFIEYLL